MEAILDGIIERELKVDFAAQISIEVVLDDKLLKKLRLAGATHFFIGFESLDIRNLEYIGKPILKNIRKSGLSVSQYYAEQITKKGRNPGECDKGTSKYEMREKEWRMGSTGNY